MASTAPPRRAGYSPMFVQKKNNKGFQLPALNIPTTSLAAGTGIPEPQPSPPPEAQEPAAPSAPAPAPANTSKPLPPIETRRAQRAGAEPGTPGTPGTLPDTPQTPNPLRSHPTSTLSLSRQLQTSEAQAAAAASNGSTGHSSGMPPATTPVASNGHAPAPSPGQGRAKPPAARNYVDPQVPTLHPHKRQPTSDSLTPPAKRPLSVRKFLGLRALSSAFSRSSIDKDERTSADGPDGARSSTSTGVYHQRNRSTDMLSIFSRRPESRQSAQPTPSLRKRRSSLMMLGRRGSSFFGLSVEEEPEPEAAPQPPSSQQRGRYEPAPSTDSRARPAVRPSEDQSMEEEENTRPRTPPPSLPGLEGLRASRGLHENGGDFMNGEDMFRDIN